MLQILPFASFWQAEGEAPVALLAAQLLRYWHVLHAACSSICGSTFQLYK